MKNPHKCPKCGSNELGKVPGSARAYGVGNNIVVGLTYFSAVLVDRYVCCSCGFSEEWINQAGIQKLKKKYL